MNKQLIFVFFILFSGCKVFNIENQKFNKKINQSTIHAHLLFEPNVLAVNKLNTKIRFLEDSIIMSTYPFLGIEVLRITVTDNTILIDQKITNNSEFIQPKTIDPNFKLSNIKKLFFQSTRQKDTIFYSNDYISFLLTDYVNNKNIFLPKKIIYWESDLINKPVSKKTINIDYRSVNF